LGARPVLRAQSSARILLVGQAPGTRVHQTGIPWNDPSGDRLRNWLEMDRTAFYNDAFMAIIPMGFCYPGKGPSGDLPPRPECAQHWRARLHQQLPHIRLTLLVGQYAQQYYLGKRMKKNLTDTVAAFEDYLPHYFPLPHPSPRNQLWLRTNEWFESGVLPALREVLRQCGQAP
jgi:uracil-DNA glycosylase